MNWRTSTTTLAVAAAVLIFGGLAVALLHPRSATPPGASASIGGPFRLTDGSGKGVTDQDLRGRWQLVYFGYTHCPDVCPTTLSSIGAAIDKMPAPARKNLGVVFITVDPARDTPKIVGDYARAFGPEFTGLTGTPQQIAAVEQAYRVYAAKHPLKGGDYAMDHSSVIYVMAPDGSFNGILDDNMQPGDLALRLEKLAA